MAAFQHAGIGFGPQLGHNGTDGRKCGRQFIRSTMTPTTFPWPGTWLLDPTMAALVASVRILWGGSTLGE
ncbi:MAG: hypothetical protein R2867_42250 [Caldilineaceae bacterium]